MKARVYALYIKGDEEFYVGSTFLSLEERLRVHIFDATRYGSSRVYTYFNKKGWKDIEMELLEERDCENDISKLWFEREWYDTLEPTLNSMPPISTPDEKKTVSAKIQKVFRQNNQEHLQDWHKNYYTEKGDFLRERARQVIHCDVCNCDTQYSTKARHEKTKKHLKNLAKQQG